MGLFSFLSKKQPEATSVAQAMAGTTSPPSAKSKNRSANKQNEQLVPEKKRARRRLVGAIALVLAVVIGLPMVLDAEQKPLSRDISIQIPAKPASPGSLDSSEEVVEDTPAASDTQLTKKSDKKEISPAASQESQAAALAAGADARDKTPDPAKTEEIHTVKPDVAKISKPESVVKSETRSEVKPEAKVQIWTEPKVPVKSEPKTDTKIEARADTGKTDTKTEKKQESKPVADVVPHKEAASKSKNDANAINTDETTRAMAILEGGSSSSTGRVIIQVAAFNTQDKAKELQDKLSSAGINAYTQKVTTSSGDKIRVRVGPFDHRDDAEKAKAKLAKMGLNSTLVSF